MSNPEISIIEAKSEKLFYVVANIVIVKPDATCLLLRRSDREIALPGYWAFPGGVLEHAIVAEQLGESGADPIEGIDNILEKLAAKEALEECGLNIVEDNSSIISNKAFVRPDKVPVFMVTLSRKVFWRQCSTRREFIYGLRLGWRSNTTKI